MRTKGTIALWNEEKGYGFISPISGGKQVFIHISAFSNRARPPELGQVVTYSTSTDKQGRPCAANATLAGDRVREPKKKRKGATSIVIAAVFIGMVGVSALVGELPLIIFTLYLVLSVLTYGAYALDKSAAKKGAWRTQESTLHLFALAGGWPGALIAQQRLRHKSKKESFIFVFWVTVVLNFGGFLWLFSSNGSEVLNSLLQSIQFGSMGIEAG